MDQTIITFITAGLIWFFISILARHHFEKYILILNLIFLAVFITAIYFIKDSNTIINSLAGIFGAEAFYRKYFSKNKLNPNDPNQDQGQKENKIEEKENHNEL